MTETETKPRITELEEITQFLRALRKDGANPGFLDCMLPWMSATGGGLSQLICKSMDIIRDDAAPVRDRAKRVAVLLGQQFQRDVRGF
jgi:hypothetical protein